MFDWDDIDEAIENDYEHAPYYVDPVYRSDKTTTFEPITQGDTKFFKCTKCGGVVSPNECTEKIDYKYCPCCGKLVAKE